MFSSIVMQGALVPSIEFLRTLCKHKVPTYNNRKTNIRSCVELIPRSPSFDAIPLMYVCDRTREIMVPGNAPNGIYR